MSVFTELIMKVIDPAIRERVLMGGQDELECLVKARRQILEASVALKEHYITYYPCEHDFYPGECGVGCDCFSECREKWHRIEAYEGWTVKQEATQ